MTTTIAWFGDARRGAHGGSRSRPAREVHDAHRPSTPSIDADRAFRWLGNHVGLDLCNTRWREGDLVIDLLVAPSQLAAWLTYAGLGDAADLLHTVDRTSARAITSWVRQFREALRATLVGPTAAHHLGELNQVLQSATGHLGVSLSGAATDVQLFSADPSGSVRLAVARAALDALALDRSRVSECSGPNCTFVYFDVSRNHRRRWCDIDRCPDRRGR